MPETVSNAYGVHRAPWRRETEPLRQDANEALHLAPRWQRGAAGAQRPGRAEEQRPETD
ncbi:hypothetical protein [Streptomyces sp. RFCAC02]|uniref:hypothetical protein n=1 Tax=Streptomyces sp. RFCAC02 TaxID=2499143 RepID=UPI00143D5D0E|nr:hypothetical protein [Streptomyces sp. RFCAC02]